MKKSIYLFGAALVAFVSCSESTVEEMAQYKAIKFNNPYTDNTVSRAIDTVGKTDLQTNNYYVFGYYGNGGNYTEVFNNTAVTDGTNPEEEAVWTENSYRFAAYANGKSNQPLDSITFDPINKTLVINSYSVGDHDLVTSVVPAEIDGKEPPAAVELTFNHILTKVKVTLKNGETNPNSRLDVTDVKIAQLYDAGTAIIDSVSVASWTPTGTRSDVLFDTENTLLTNIAGSATATSDERYVLPGTYASISISFTAKIYDQNGNIIQTKACNGTITDITWKPGRAYNLTATIVNTNDNKIRFEVKEVSDWQIDPTDKGIGTI